jgi:hypothetical protein
LIPLSRGSASIRNEEKSRNPTAGSPTHFVGLLWGRNDVRYHQIGEIPRINRGEAVGGADTANRVSAWPDYLRRLVAVAVKPRGRRADDPLCVVGGLGDRYQRLAQSLRP